MTPTTTKYKKTSREVTAATPVKRTRRAGNENNCPCQLWEDDAISQKLDAITKLMADLSIKMQDLSGYVDATEEWQKEAEMSPVSLHNSCSTRRRASSLGVT